MKRICDRIMKGEGWVSTGDPQGDFQELNELVKRDRLRSTTIFDVQNVESYVASLPTWHPDLPPCLRPPFQQMWMEYELNSYRIGIFICSSNSHCIGRQWVTGPGMNGRIEAVPTGFVAKFDDDGSVTEDNFMMRCSTDKPRHGEITYRLLAPFLLAIGFMHCKNVTVRSERKPDRLIKAINKRRGGSPGLVKWNVLEIEPMKKIMTTEGLVESTGIKNALHICRGHFKDYRQSGLFGKVKGIFWWDANARGSSQQGVVVKDYKIGESP